MWSVSRFNRHRLLSRNCNLVTGLIQLRLLLFVLLLELLKFLFQLFNKIVFLLDFKFNCVEIFLYFCHFLLRLTFSFLKSCDLCGQLFNLLSQHFYMELHLLLTFYVLSTFRFQLPQHLLILFMCSWN